MLWGTPQLNCNYCINKDATIGKERTVRYEKERSSPQILCKRPLQKFIKTFLSDFKGKVAE
jgi:hypothetical protein